MNRKKRILVTGAAGFIGSNLTRSLLKKGNVQVIGLDNFDDFYSREQKEMNMSAFISDENFSFFEGDIRNMDDLLALPEVDVIVHLAAKAGVRPSILNPVLYQDVNVAGLQDTAQVRLVRRARTQSLDGRFLVAEGFQESVRKLGRVKGLLREVRDGLFDFYCVHGRAVLPPSAAAWLLSSLWTLMSFRASSRQSARQSSSPARRDEIARCRPT